MQIEIEKNLEKFFFFFFTLDLNFLYAIISTRPGEKMGRRGGKGKETKREREREREIMDSATRIIIDFFAFSKSIEFFFSFTNANRTE